MTKLQHIKPVQLTTELKFVLWMQIIEGLRTRWTRGEGLEPLHMIANRNKVIDGTGRYWTEDAVGIITEFGEVRSLMGSSHFIWVRLHYKGEDFNVDIKPYEFVQQRLLNLESLGESTLPLEINDWIWGEWEEGGSSSLMGADGIQQYIAICPKTFFHIISDAPIEREEVQSFIDLYHDGFDVPPAPPELMDPAMPDKPEVVEFLPAGNQPKPPLLQRLGRALRVLKGEE